MADYNSGFQPQWREVKGGELPSGRWKLKAAMVNDIIYVTGGQDDHFNDLTSVLAWDPVAESWQDVGDLAVARFDHAAVAVPDSVMKCP